MIVSARQVLTSVASRLSPAAGASRIHLHEPRTQRCRLVGLHPPCQYRTISCRGPCIRAPVIVPSTPTSTQNFFGFPPASRCRRCVERGQIPIVSTQDDCTMGGVVLVRPNGGAGGRLCLGKISERTEGWHGPGSPAQRDGRASTLVLCDTTGKQIPRCIGRGCSCTLIS
jgi:hypothetical protein